MVDPRSEDEQKQPRSCSIRKVVPRNFTIFTRKHPVLESLFNKVAGPACKKFLHFFNRTLPVAASGLALKEEYLFTVARS